MNIFKQLLLKAIILLLITACSKIDKKTETHIILKNINIIPMTDEVLYENKSVLISNEKIMFIGDYKDIEIPKDTQIIDGNGRYLIPALNDMHTHIYSEEFLYMHLANGVTLVRNMNGTEYTLSLKNKIINNIIDGPEIYTTGPIIDGENPIGKFCISLTKPSEVKEALTNMKNKGYDAIKVYEMLSPEVFFKIIEVAKDLSMPVFGHPPRSVEFEDVLLTGQSSNEHLRGYTDYDSLEEIIQKTIDSGIWNCPTIHIKYVYNNYTKVRESEPDEIKYYPKNIIDSWENNIFKAGVFEKNKYSSYLDEAMNLLLKLHKSGAKIVAGTDSGVPYVFPGFSLHDELELYTKSGLTPYEALLTATKNPSLFLGFEDRLGTIEVGKEADLIILDKNPLIDIRNTRTIAGIFLNGKWITKKELDDKLKRVEAKYKY